MLAYAKVEGRVTAFVIDKESPGFSTGEPIKKMGMRASTMCELIFEDVAVPVENRLGEEGGGITCMMRNLEIERLCLAAMSLGIADRCLQDMVEYALLAGFIAVAAGAVLPGISTSISQIFSKMASITTAAAAK